MSLSNIRTYFRSRLDSLGFREHVDGFETENIAETILDRSYHIYVSNIVGGPINHTHQDMSANVVISLYFKGYRNSTEGLETAETEVESIVKDICKVSNRTSSLLNVIFEDVSLERRSESNDHSVLALMQFTAQVVLDVES